MEQIVISQNENQNIRVNSSDPQTIRLSNITPQNIGINELENQNVNISQAENQVILVNESGVFIGINDVLVNGVSVVTDDIAYVIVPTKTSELVNDSGFITREVDPTVPNYVKQISLADINNWNSKQNALVSGSTIKTINNTSLLGSGNIEISGSEYQAGTGININASNVISNEITSYNDLEDLPDIPTKVSDLINDENFINGSELADVAFSGSYADLSNTPNIPAFTSDLTNDSGFIDKNVNDLTYYPLSSSLATVATSGNYNDLSNTPTIPTVNDGILTIQKNGTTIDTFTANSSANKTVNVVVPTTTNELSNNSGFIDNSVNNLTNYMLSSDINTALGNKQDTLTYTYDTYTTNGFTLRFEKYGRICVITAEGATTSNLVTDTNYTVGIASKYTPSVDLRTNILLNENGVRLYFTLSGTTVSYRVKSNANSPAYPRFNIVYISSN